MEHHIRHILAWVLGCLGVAMSLRLWAALPQNYRTGTSYLTDE